MGNSPSEIQRSRGLWRLPEAARGPQPNPAAGDPHGAETLFFSCHEQGQGRAYGCDVLWGRKKSPAPNIGRIQDIQKWESADQELPKAGALLLELSSPSLG